MLCKRGRNEKNNCIFYSFLFYSIFSIFSLDAAIRLTWDSYFSGFPSIAVDVASDVHVVWTNEISGSYYDIFY